MIGWRALFLVGLILAGSAEPACAARRAFLVGIAKYPRLGKPLDNPVVDVGALAPKLKEAGYVVTIVLEEQASKTLLVDAFDNFLGTIDEHDEVFVYYSGHGLDIRGENMLVPYDSPPSEELGGEYAAKSKMIAMRPWMEAIEERAADIQVWVIDACRDNPYAGGRPWATKGGLNKSEYVPSNSFILYSAKYTQVAADKLSSEPLGAKLGSPFSRKFVALFDTYKRRDINEFALEVRRQVVNLVRPDPQFPTFENAVLDQWCLDTCAEGVQQVSVDNLKSSRLLDLPKTLTGPALIATSQNDTNIGGEKPAVFLGKFSAANCAVNSISDLYPFGCGLLKQVATSFEQDGKRSSSARVATVSTAVYVRKGLPTPGARGTSYGCKIRVLKPGEKVKLATAVALKYAGDTFYWGTIDGPAEACSTEASLRNPTPNPAAYRRVGTDQTSVVVEAPGATATSTGQTGGVTAGAIGSVVQTTPR